MKYCEQCEYLDLSVHYTQRKCSHRKAETTIKDPIFGESTRALKCSEMRRLFGRCGKRGKLFKSRNSTD